MYIEVPHDSPSDYHNRKGWHSVILQALVDDVGNFNDICVGWPGKVHDAYVLQNSQLYAKEVDHAACSKLYYIVCSGPVLHALYSVNNSVVA